MSRRFRKTDDTRRPLAVFSGGFLKERRLRRILSLAGWKVEVGIRPETEAVAVWGRRPVSARGLAAATRAGLPVLTVEDAFLRSVLPGRLGGEPIGLLLDRQGPHFAGDVATELETRLATGDFSDSLARARDGIAFLRKHRLSKYNAWASGPLPEPGFVLVVDQTAGDASIAHGRAGPETFHRMLAAAKAEHPGRRVVIRAHPEVWLAGKAGHLSDADGEVLAAPANPWDLLARAEAVYCVTSQLGFEAVLAGHRPVVFGAPFYAGWGLTEDRLDHPRRRRALSAEALFAGAMLDYPVWYDPHSDALTSFEVAAAALAAAARAEAEDGPGWVLTGMSAWKRARMTAFFGSRKAPILAGPDAVAAARSTGRPLGVWAGRETPDLRAKAATAEVPLSRIEDGFLRSVGLGAALIPAASMVVDREGIYFDATRPSALEALIAAAEDLTQGERARAARLIAALRDGGVTKYNLAGPVAPLGATPGQPVVLVAGQVSDDASIRLGCPGEATNAGLLAAARAAEPGAWVIYKPHPDVLAGLRPGEIGAEAADQVVTGPAAALLGQVDRVWTLTSLLGFEALVRGVEVHCLGVPFYAGWGLTVDHAPVPARRQARPGLEGLVHAALIDYPRYFDPVTGTACPVEVIVARLAAREVEVSRNGEVSGRVLARLQGVFRRWAPLWRGGRGPSG